MGRASTNARRSTTTAAARWQFVHGCATISALNTDDESRYVIVDEERRSYGRTFERFDRIAFAIRALRILKPESLRVAVYTRVRDLRVERGRDLDSGGTSGFALLGIPPDASRESIALALADLAGLAEAPFVVDLLVLAGANAES
jgi:hypothetical protein